VSDVRKGFRTILRVVGRRLLPGVSLLPRLFSLRDLKAARVTRQRKPGATDFLVVSLRSGWLLPAVLEQGLGLGLQARGHHVRVLECGGAPIECGFHNPRYGATRPCTACRFAGHVLAGRTGLPALALREWFDSGEVAAARRAVRALTLAECRAYSADGLPLGRLVEPSVLGYFTRGTLEDDHVPYYRAVLASAVPFARATRRFLKQQPSGMRLVMTSGIFWPERILWELAQRAGHMNTVLYERGFIRDTWVFARNQPPGYYDLTQHWAKYRDRPLTAEELSEIREYIASRESFTKDIVSYAGRWERASNQLRDLTTRAGGRPIIAAFSNIVWDSAIIGRDLRFEGMFDWVRSLVRYAATHPNHFVVLRGHPAEVALEGAETAETLQDYLRSLGTPLPENFVYVPPDSRINSYRLADLATVGVVYASTIGLEMVLRGRPVVVCGLTHYGALGFADEAGDSITLLAALERVCDQAPPAEEIERRRVLAERYASLFFFRQMVPIEWLGEHRMGVPRFSAAGFTAELRQVHSPTSQVLDFIEDGATGQFIFEPSRF
jgi:hypothetical protein